jgi:hypothetical protein
MDLKILQKSANSWRLDHPDLKDVYETTFAKGVITAFYPGTDDGPVVAKDMCDVTVDSGEFKGVPIFYHPQKDWVANWKENTDRNIHMYGGLFTDSAAWAKFWNASGKLVDKDGNPIENIPGEGLAFDGHSVARGAYSFSVGDEVTVMLQKGEAVAVVGFADGKPRRPFDYVQVEMPTQVMDTGNDPPIVGDPHTPYILQLSDLDRLITPSGLAPGYQPPTGDYLAPDGFNLKLLKDAKQFPDKVGHPPPGEPIPLDFEYDYQCFYGTEKVPRGNIELEGYYWSPNPDPQFGPFWGYMNKGYNSPWATYLADWQNTCDIVQTLDRGTMNPNPWVGTWPLGYGRPDYWLWLMNDAGNPANQVIEDDVMRTYLFEVGPLLYLLRVFYQHTRPPAEGGRVYYWRNRIAWPWDSNTPPPSDWSGYANWGGYSALQWTGPMWVAGPNPWPTKAENCIPPPDGYLPGNNNQETFYTDNPHYLYVAPASKKILDNIEGIVAASNGQINVWEAQRGVPVTAIPEGFKEIANSFVVPDSGNYRELKFKIAKRIGI